MLQLHDDTLLLMIGIGLAVLVGMILKDFFDDKHDHFDMSGGIL